MLAETRPSPTRKTMRRKPAEESRPDPRRRRRQTTEDGHLGLIQKDPEMHYVWAHKTEICGRPHYEAIGYEVSLVREGGVRSALKPNQPIGEEITSLDCVLMELPLVEKEEIHREGEWGTTGQRFIDVLQRKIFKPDGRARRLRDMRLALEARDIEGLGERFDGDEAEDMGRY